MLCELVICQHQSAWYISGKKITLERCYHVFSQPKVWPPPFIPVKLYHCQVLLFLVVFQTTVYQQRGEIQWNKVVSHGSSYHALGKARARIPTTHHYSQLWNPCWLPLCSLGSECPSHNYRSNWISTPVYTSFFLRLGRTGFCFQGSQEGLFFHWEVNHAKEVLETCNVHSTYNTSEISSNMMYHHSIKSPRCIRKTYT